MVIPWYHRLIQTGEMKMFKAIKNYAGYEFAVVDKETGEMAEAGHKTWEEAKKAARNFNRDWN